MGSTRISKLPLRTTAESTNVSETSSSTTPEQKKVPTGIAEVKDSFAARKDDHLVTLDSTKGQVRFGDGTQGKIPEAASKASVNYRSGLGQSGNQVNEQSPVQAAERKSPFFSGKLLAAGDLALEQESIRNKRTLDSASNSVAETPQSGNDDALDPNELVQFVLRESYIQTTEDLRLYAEETKHANQLKKQSASSGIPGKTGVISDAGRSVHKKKKDDGDP